MSYRLRSCSQVAGYLVLPAAVIACLLFARCALPLAQAPAANASQSSNVNSNASQQVRVHSPSGDRLATSQPTAAGGAVDQ